MQNACIVNTYGTFWPNDTEKGMKPKIFSELMTHNLKDASKLRALSDPDIRFSIAADIAEAITTFI